GVGECGSLLSVNKDDGYGSAPEGRQVVAHGVSRGDRSAEIRRSPGGPTQSVAPPGLRPFCHRQPTADAVGYYCRPSGATTGLIQERRVDAQWFVKNSGPATSAHNNCPTPSAGLSADACRNSTPRANSSASGSRTSTVRNASRTRSAADGSAAMRLTPGPG